MTTILDRGYAQCVERGIAAHPDIVCKVCCVQDSSANSEYQYHENLDLIFHFFR